MLYFKSITKNRDDDHKSALELKRMKRKGRGTKGAETKEDSLSQSNHSNNCHKILLLTRSSEAKSVGNQINIFIS